MKCNNKVLILFSIFFVFFLSISCNAYPDLQYTPNNYPEGEVDITGQASSGVNLELFINNARFGSQIISANTTRVILDGSDIEDVIIAYGSSIIFENQAIRDYSLNISGDVVNLVFEEEYIFSPDEMGSFSYYDINEDTSAIIEVVDQLVDFNFNDVTNELISGENDITFRVSYPYNNYNQTDEYNFSLRYEPYQNDINVLNYTNITPVNSVDIIGYVESVSYPLYYVVNIHPNDIGNPGVLNNISLDGDMFNVSISGLQEGNNDIYFVTTDPSNPNIFTGLQEVNVIVDTIAPDIDIVKTTYEKEGNVFDFKLSDKNYINGNILNIEIESDAVLLNYTFNNESFGKEIVNNSVNISLSLEEGSNPLVLRAFDSAGNMAKRSHKIFFDDTKPQILQNSLEPEDMFETGIAHFFFQDIKGRTDKPNVKVTIFSLNNDAQIDVYSEDAQVEQESVTCEHYKEMFMRNLGQLDNEDVDSSELNLKERQISLTNLMFQKTTVNADAGGKFEALIGLQEKDFSSSNYNDNVDNSNDESSSNNNPEIDSVKSDNTICFILTDRYGNIGVHREEIELDAGNTMWEPQDITTVPNTIYAAELEQSGDVREGTGNIEIGIIANFQYIGSGEVSHLSNFRVRTDTEAIAEDSYYDIDTSRTNYVLDKETGEMTVYFPVKFSPQNIKPADYPSEYNLAFEARVTYTVGDKDIPIDTKNPIYFQTQVNIERPLESAEWLTPELITDTLEFLNKSIKYTEQAVDVMQLASVGGVVTCTGMKFWHAWKKYKIMTTKDNKAEQRKKLDEINRKLYLVCDRVACTGAPPRCKENNDGLSSLFSGVNDYSELKETNPGESLPLNHQNTELINNKEQVLGEINEVKSLGKCKTDLGEEGVLLKVNSESYDKNSSFFSNSFFGFKKVEAEHSGKKCVSKDEWDTMAVENLGGGGVCFSTKAPFYDDTRCNFFGLDGIKGNPDDGKADTDPATNIFSSIRCGCITDTYSHLNNYLKMQEAIKKCLQQARIGETEGSYCERLMGIAVCDIGTNIILPEILKSIRSAPGVDGEDNRNLNFISYMQDTEKSMNDRYSGTIMSQTGLQTDQIINKACLGAITGDWSVLTDNILSAVEQNEVEPIFGPPLPVSRVQGYNPITGELSIQYRFTHAVVSGGQKVKTQAYLICDPNDANGEYCPNSYMEVDEIGGNRISPLIVRDGGTSQDSIILTDTQAKYWYNKLKLVHTYSLKGDQQTKTEEFGITHKGEVVPQCSFSLSQATGGGFSCDAIFTDDAMISRFEIGRNTRFTPQNTFYEGDIIRMLLNYNIRGDGTQDNFGLYYIAECPGLESGTTIYLGGSEDISVEQKEGITAPYGYQLVELFGGGGIPKLNIDEENNKILYPVDTTEVLEKDKTYSIIFENLDSEKSKEISFGFIDEDIDVSDSKTFSLGVDDEKSINFNVKKEINVNQLKLEMFKDFEDVKVTLKINDSNLIAFSNPTEEVDSDIMYTLKDMKEGLCTLYARILPDTVTKFTSLEEFKDYDVSGEDIDTNLNEDEIKEFNFKILKTDNRNNIITDLVYPVDKTAFCLDESDKLQGIYDDLVLLIQSSDGDVAGKNLKYNIRVTSDSVTGNLLKEEVKEAIIDESKESNDLLNKFDTDKIKDGLNNQFKKIEAELEVEVFDKDRSDYSETHKKELIITKCDKDTIFGEDDKGGGKEKQQTISYE